MHVGFDRQQCTPKTDNTTSPTDNGPTQTESAAGGKSTASTNNNNNCAQHLANNKKRTQTHSAASRIICVVFIYGAGATSSANSLGLARAVRVQCWHSLVVR